MTEFELDKKISRRIFLTAGSLAGLMFSSCPLENALASAAKNVALVNEAWSVKCLAYFGQYSRLERVRF